MQAIFNGYEVEKVVGVVPKNIEYFDDEISNYPQDKSSIKLKEIMGYDQHRIAPTDISMSDLQYLELSTY